MRNVFLSCFCFHILTASSASAGGLELIAPRMTDFLSQCTEFLTDPDRYAAQLPPVNSDGSQVVTTSPDTKSTAINLQIDDYAIEADIHRHSDREFRYCEYSAVQPVSVPLSEIADQFSAWISQNPNLELVGGHIPAAFEETARHSVLGLLPQFDAIVISNIYENHFWVHTTYVVRDQ